MTNILIAGAKGGVGTSTIAAVTALELHRAGIKVHLAAKDTSDLATLLGMPTPDQPTVEVTEGFTLSTDVHAARDGYTTIIDNGTTMPDQYDGKRVLVVANCHLAARRAQTMPRPDQVMLVLDDERPLTRSDIEAIVGMPATVVRRTVEISRAIDAGLLAYRMPKILRHAAAI